MFLEFPHELPESYKKLNDEVKNKLWELLSEKYHLKRLNGM
jgi:hypothetical protein